MINYSKSILESKGRHTERVELMQRHRKYFKPIGFFEDNHNYSLRKRIFMRHQINIPRKQTIETYNNFFKRYLLADETKIVEKPKTLQETTNDFEERIEQAYIKTTGVQIPESLTYHIILNQTNN